MATGLSSDTLWIVEDQRSRPGQVWRRRYNRTAMGTQPTPSTRVIHDPDQEIEPPYHLVLLDDNEHTYQYVIDMLGSLFGYDRNKAYQLAEEVDRTGRVILLTTTKEHAELKRDQIHAFGPDKRIQRCAGSMSAVIEPVS